MSEQLLQIELKEIWLKWLWVIIHYLGKIDMGHQIGQLEYYASKFHPESHVRETHQVL